MLNSCQLPQLTTSNCELWNSQSSSLMQLPTISMPSLLSSFAEVSWLPTLVFLSNHSQLTRSSHCIALGQTQQQTPFPNNLFIVTSIFIAAETCLLSRCLECQLRLHYSGFQSSCNSIFVFPITLKMKNAYSPKQI